MTVSEIIPGRVYQGPTPLNADDWAQLSALGVDAIIDLQTEPENGPGIALPPDATGKYVLFWAPIKDEPVSPSMEWLLLVAEVAALLYHSNRHIYIHCQAGISRASLVDIALHMFVFNLRWVDAYERVKAKRPIADPNPMFMAALQKFEELLF